MPHLLVAMQIIVYVLFSSGHRNGTTGSLLNLPLPEISLTLGKVRKPQACAIPVSILSTEIRFSPVQNRTENCNLIEECLAEMKSYITKREHPPQR